MLEDSLDLENLDNKVFSFPLPLASFVFVDILDPENLRELKRFSSTTVRMR